MGSNRRWWTHWRPRFCIAGLSLALAGVAVAQSLPTQPSLRIKVTKVSVEKLPAVTSEVLVTRPDGSLVGCLGSDEFEARQDGRPVSPHLSQSPAADLGAVVLVIDRSDSMAGRPLSEALSLARRILGRLPANYLVGLTASDGPTKIETRATSDRDKLEQDLRHITVGGADDLNAGIRRATSLLSSSAERRAIVIVTDGRARGTQRITALRSAGTTAHVVLVGAAARQRRLRRLAQATGGLLLASPSADDLTRLCQAMAPNASGRYSLTFYSDPTPQPRWYDLEIGVRYDGEAAAERVRFLSRRAEEDAAVAPPDPRPLLALGGIGVVLLIANIAVLWSRKRAH